MNHRQYRACLERLEGLNGNAARRFEELARESDHHLALGFQAQRECWNLYHQFFPRAERAARHG